MESAAAGKQLEFTYDFKAPPEKVWKAWTEPQHFERWFGPHGFDSPNPSLDPRVGGKYKFQMRGLEGKWQGKEVWSAGTYEEVVPNERLSWIDNFADAQGNTVDPATYGMQDYPNGTKVSLQFEPRDGGTHMTVRRNISPEVAQKYGEEAGWKQSFEKLDNYLAEMK